jgi:hypothetical protein
MVTEYQVFLCSLLLVRLIYLRQGDVVGWKYACAIGIVQSALVLLTFGLGRFAWVTVAVVMGCNLLGGWCETKRNLHWVRLGVLAGIALILAALYPLLGGLSFSAVSLWFASYLGEIAAALGYSGPYKADRVLSVLLAILLLANESNIAMRGIFQFLDLIPRDSSISQKPDIREYNAGRVIGILERWLMFLVILLAGDWNALGFIIAAKGLVRFDKLRDPVFAEYMLTGTLMSVLFSISALLLVRL